MSKKQPKILSVTGSNLYRIPKPEFDRITKLYPNTKKNSDIGKSAIHIVKTYFRHIYPDATFPKGVRGSDIKVASKGIEECFEVKGTNAADVNWNALRVSSRDSHRLLMSGLRLIRVSGIGSKNVILTFLEHKKDFIMVREPRWRIKRVK